MKYTQDQLEGMSDREIDWAIVSIIYGTEDKDIRRIFSSGGFDYCNSWADMGPIIGRERISLIPVSNMDVSWLAVPESGLHSHRSVGNNPLRAAAIVYILVKQEGLA